jgi:hypothetical protein
MFLCRLSRLAVAGAVLATGIPFATPASASVTYDPETKSGFVGGGDVRNAFGWTGAMLESRASGIVFDHGFWSDDTYSAVCGERAFPLVHHREYGHFELIDAVAHEAKGNLRAGPPGRVTGFRLAGMRTGISGTSVPPAAGQPCPDGQGQTPGRAIDRIRLVSSTTGWSLTVKFKNVQHNLLVREGHKIGKNQH